MVRGVVNVVIVDWLGRGGIADISAAWHDALADRGVASAVVTREGRDLVSWIPEAITVPERMGAVWTHRALARAAARHIVDVRPALVVVQNFVIPPLERAVLKAAHRVGAMVVLVIHDDQLHARMAGTRAGLRGQLRSADVVVTHSRYVAERIRGLGGPPPRVLPLPQAGRLLATLGQAAPLVNPGQDHLAVHFGILTRSYKGTNLVLDMARAGVHGWRFALFGRGAPQDPAVSTVSRFLTPEELVNSLSVARVAVLPYRFATQSGAVSLAQSLGVVPVSTAVGGIPEQITDGEDGVVLASGSGVNEWRSALDRLTDDRNWSELSSNARARTESAQATFVAAVAQLVAD